MITVTCDGITIKAYSALEAIGKMLAADGQGGFTMASSEPASWPDFLADGARKGLRLPLWRAPAELRADARALLTLRALHRHGAITLTEEP